MNIKKIPKQASVWALTIGASLITGLLSVGGMLALSPMLAPFAIPTFILAVAYEGEIYKKNIIAAFKKFLKSSYIERSVAKELLLNQFPVDLLNDKNTPLFFRDYYKQLQLLHHFEHKQLDEASLKLKRKVEKTLGDMEKFFANNLFHPQQKPTSYQTQLANFFDADVISRANKRSMQLTNLLFAAKLFVGVVAVFMTLSSTYLLMEAFAGIAFFAVIPAVMLPVLVLPMALISGIAYSLLTYNALSDFILHDSVGKWIKTIANYISDEGITLQNTLLIIATIGLSLLTLALTLCTAGTWWTIASKTKPLFAFMGRFPVFVMGIINPLVTGIAQLIFSLQNTGDTLVLIDKLSRKSINMLSFIQTKLEALLKVWIDLLRHENPLQFINPFRLLIKLTFTPLQVMLFLGHTLTMALMSDRFPSVSEKISIALGIVGEVAVDLHYFTDIGHDDVQAHEPKELLKQRLDSSEGHHHDDDLPTQLLSGLFIPLYCLATLWDWSASQLNPSNTIDEVRPKPLNLSEAWQNQWGTSEPEHVTLPCADSCTQTCKPLAIYCDTLTPSEEKLPSEAWQKEQALYRIEKEERRLNEAWFDAPLARDKANSLQTLREKLIKSTLDHKIIINNYSDEVFGQHRFFNSAQSTETKHFFEEALLERITPGHAG